MLCLTIRAAGMFGNEKPGGEIEPQTDRFVAAAAKTAPRGSR
jgi:hypothetical protein